MSSNLRSKALIFLAFAGIFCAATSYAHAQSAVGNSVPPVTYVVSPETPGPNQLVYIEVQGVGDFLGNSDVTWTQNGKVAASGVGKRDFSFTSGPLGSQTTIGVSINSHSEYGIITHTFTFNPSLVSLAWEGNTTAPPLYPGRALYSAGSSVRVAAFPSVAIGGRTMSSSQLSFQWKLNDAAVPEQSGLGRNVFVFDGNWLHGSEKVSVNVDTSSATVGHAEITIPASAPLVDLYAVDALRGVLYDHALLGTVSMLQMEQTFRAEPYFFAAQSAAQGALQYAWTLNGNDVSGSTTPRQELTLRQTTSDSGEAVLSVSIQNLNGDKFTQQATRDLVLTFGQVRGALQSLFGI